MLELVVALKMDRNTQKTNPEAWNRYMREYRRKLSLKYPQTKSTFFSCVNCGCPIRKRRIGAYEKWRHYDPDRRTDSDECMNYLVGAIVKEIPYSPWYGVISIWSAKPSSDALTFNAITRERTLTQKKCGCKTPMFKEENDALGELMQERVSALWKRLIENPPAP